jgi:hypothetical protein
VTNVARLAAPHGAASRDKHALTRKVRCGSGTDIHGTRTDVRYSPESGHRPSALRGPLRASSRHRSPRSFETGATLKLQYGRLPTSAVE